ncbi:MAG: fused MFS/spermidine synthase [Myxococcaceae bacterium]|nr:fused MFS/spermidine synthase [Myxococcaceae bacterium]
MNPRIAAMFVASGAAGLVFEVALQRSLTRVFGVSAFATSSVLAAYMAGLALGALLFGARAERTKSPLRLYAALELGIGVCAAVLPVVTPRLVGLFATWLQGTPEGAPKLLVARFAIALVVTLGPTLLMGGTLPVVARALVKESVDTAVVGRLYLLNLLGAALGAAVAAYLLMPSLGLSGTAWVGAALNLGAAGIALSLRSTEGGPRAAPVAPEGSAGLLLPAAALASGLITFAIEVGWFQLLAVVVGCSAYAFGLMLAIFLVGLVLGSAWVARQPDERVDFALLGRVLLLAAAAFTLTIPLCDAVPKLFVTSGSVVTSFAGRELVRALACVEVMLLPAAALGAVYPLVLRLAARRSDVGRAVGRIAAANTLGSVIGSLGAGFLLLPAVGTRGVIVIVAVACAVLSALWLKGRQRLAPLAFGVIVLAMPGWNMVQLGSGANVYFTETPYSQGELVWARESVASGLTTVVKIPGGASVLLTNGKFQGADEGETDAQLAIAQQPLLFQQTFGRALVIGIGTGCTLGVVGNAGFREVVGVDLSRDIVAAARTHFGAVNDHIFDTDKVRVEYTDGRNFLLLDPAPWDLISLEISSIWFAGAADLYNREFYQLVRERLTPKGVLQQWVQLHHLTRRDAAIILQSIRSELPHVALFFRGGQGIIIASRDPLAVDYPVVNATSRRLTGTFATSGVPAGDLLTVAGTLVLDEAGVVALIEDEAKKAGRSPEQLVSTDDNLWLEYSTPRGNADQSLMPDTFIASLKGLGSGALPLVGAQSDAQRAHARAADLIGRGNFKVAKELLEGPAADAPNAAPLREWLLAQLAAEKR